MPWPSDCADFAEKLAGRPRLSARWLVGTQDSAGAGGMPTMAGTFQPEAQRTSGSGFAEAARSAGRIVEYDTALESANSLLHCAPARR